MRLLMLFITYAPCYSYDRGYYGELTTMEYIDFEIDKYSHYFRVLPVSAMARRAVVDYMSTLIEHTLTKKRGRWSMTPDCVYAAKDVTRGRYHLHINGYEEFLLHLEKYRITTDTILVVEHELYKPVKVDLKLLPKWVAREVQRPVIEYCTTADIQAAVTAVTGGGKTFMLMAAAAARGERFAVRAPGGMSSQWEKAFKDYLGLKKEDGEYVMCNGAKALRKLIKEVRTTDKHKNLKAAFISNGAIRDLIKFMDTPEHDGECGGLFHPASLCETLGLGLVGVDEAHKEMHSNFVADLYTHCPLRVALTATLIPRDAFSAKKYELYLPQRTRRDLGKLHVYVDLTEVLYNLAKPDKFRRVIKQSVYSHNEFERTIMQDKETLHRYLDALYKYVISTWLGERVYETKAIFYCGLVDMGTAFTQYFAKRLPDMRVVQYNAGDPYDVLLDNDLIFSTAIKAGTAVDIPHLSRVYNAISIDAPNTLVQIVGRLRYHEHLVQDGFHFHQFCCLDIPKQMGYKANRKTLLTPRVKSIREVPLGKLI